MHLSLKYKLFLIGCLIAVSSLIPGTDSAGVESTLSSEQKISKGIFLIADPRLTHPNFRESVVLITRHGADGSIGIIINRPTKQPLASLLPDLPRPCPSHPRRR